MDEKQVNAVAQSGCSHRVDRRRNHRAQTRKRRPRPLDTRRCIGGERCGDRLGLYAARKVEKVGEAARRRRQIARKSNERLCDWRRRVADDVKARNEKNIEDDVCGEFNS